MKHTQVGKVNSIPRQLQQLPHPKILLANRNGSRALNAASYRMLGKPVRPMGKATFPVSDSISEMITSMRVGEDFTKAAQLANMQLLNMFRAVGMFLGLRIMLGPILDQAKSRRLR
jgi:hypothetical protein